MADYSNFSVDIDIKIDGSSKIDPTEMHSWAGQLIYREQGQQIGG